MNIKWIIFVLSFALASCSKQKDDEKAKEEENLSKSETEKVADPIVKTEVSEVYIPDRLKPKATDDEVGRSVKEFLVKMQKSGDSTRFVFRNWDEHWIPKFDEPLGKDNDTVSVKLENFTDGLIPDLAETLPKSQEDWMKDDDMRKSAIILMGSTAVLVEKNSVNQQGESSAGDLPILMGRHRNRMPPTTGDLLLLRISGVTKILLEHSPELTDHQIQEWLDFAKSKNPVYRMIALDLFEKMDSTPEQSKLFYESFMKESEIGILKKINQDLASVKKEWAEILMQNTEKKLSPR